MLGMIRSLALATRTVDRHPDIRMSIPHIVWCLPSITKIGEGYVKITNRPTCLIVKTRVANCRWFNPVLSGCFLEPGKKTCYPTSEYDRIMRIHGRIQYDDDNRRIETTFVDLIAAVKMAHTREEHALRHGMKRA